MTLAQVAATDLLTLLNAKNAPEEMVKELESSFERSVEERVLHRLQESVSDEDRPALQAAFEAGDDAIETFLNERGLNIQQIALEESIFHKAELYELLSGEEIEAGE